ncbi:MAG: PfkB family carbohydrate kinase [Halobacteriaceae archaeon]
MSDVLDRLADSLDALGGRVAALPDGSIDTYYRVTEGRARRVSSRDTFGDRIAASRASSFQIAPQRREPGGQAVNAARQAGALGADTTLYGHLDDPLFDRLDVATRSMGDPAEVSVLSFDDGELMLSEESGDLLNWGPAALREAGSGPLADADTVCCGNWVSLSGMDDALRALPELADGATVVFDPGDVTGCTTAELGDLTASLAACAADAPVVLSVNAAEAHRLAGATDVTADGVAARLDAIRDRAGLRAAVIHERSRAVLATSDGVTIVPNPSVDEATRRTGAGDRFDGGLSVGLAAGLDVDLAAALGNCCASHYVATAETGDVEAIRRFISER